jgi:hypothetical protein
MLRNAEIAEVMAAIVDTLMPLCGKEPNPELWHIYNALQRWEFWVESGGAHAAANEPARTVQEIELHLATLRDRALADAIGELLQRYSPSAIPAPLQAGHCASA